MYDDTWFGLVRVRCENFQFPRNLNLLGEPHKGSVVLTSVYQGLAVEQKRSVYLNKLKHEYSKQTFVKNINSVLGIF